LVSALEGQQFLIITVSVMAPPDTHSKLVQAAAKAGVPYVMPNCYGEDFTDDDEKFSKENIVGDVCRTRIAEIEAAGVSLWVALVCGF
jgi:saccharopine dehydrogenase-like NADP-dependent oxidoreductase